jgi:phenylalanyl-tRNA synthetase beta chain
MPQMVQTLRNNIYKGTRDLKLFEIRPVYLPTPGQRPPFSETWHLCLGMSGARRPLHFLEKDETGPDPEFQGVTLLDLKGYLQALVQDWQPDRARLVEKHQARPYFHPKQQMALELRLEGPELEVQALGLAGRLHPQLLEEWDIPVPIVVAEIKLDLFLTEWKNSIQFQEISPFPTVWRDLNLIVEESLPSGAVQEVIGSQGGVWLRNVELFDVYRGAPLKEGQKALTFRIEYGAPDRTLTDVEVNEAREVLLKKLKEAIGATLR